MRALSFAKPGADLAVCAALTSSSKDIPIAEDTIAIGEVGLAGELRSASGTERRLAEAARLGFKRAIVPASDAQLHAPLEVIGAATVREALTNLGLGRSPMRQAA